MKGARGSKNKSRVWCLGDEPREVVGAAKRERKKQLIRRNRDEVDNSVECGDEIVWTNRGQRSPRSEIVTETNKIVIKFVGACVCFVFSVHIKNAIDSPLLHCVCWVIVIVPKSVSSSCAMMS